MFGFKPSAHSTKSKDPVAGWYEDPNDVDALRYWNGTAWAEATMSKEDIAQGVGPAAVKKAKQIEEALQCQASSDALEVQHRQHVAQVNETLDAARKHAQSGQIAKEEAKISRFIALSQTYGGKVGRTNAEKFISEMVARGEIRVGCTHIGEISREGGMSQYARLNNLSSVQIGSKSATIFSDRIFHDSRVYPIDAHTAAQVTLDGITQITQRPTLTRMALLSPLPGTALIPGLALQKKKQNDLRVATFIAASTSWSFTIAVNPNDIATPRRIAEQINRIAQSMESTQQTSLTSTNTVGHSKVDELHRLQKLFQDGVISQKEFDTLKHEIINRMGES